MNWKQKEKVPRRPRWFAVVPTNVGRQVGKYKWERHWVWLEWYYYEGMYCSWGESYGTRRWQEGK